MTWLADGSLRVSVCPRFPGSIARSQEMATRLALRFETPDSQVLVAADRDVVAQQLER